MKITTIFYQKTFPIAQFANEKIGMEASIDEDEHYGVALLNLKAHVEELHRLGNPQLYGEQPPENPAAVPTEKPQKTVLDDIMACTFIEGINGLKGWYPIAKSNVNWLEAYNLKMEELSK